ncbi:MAG: 50S ribosomal protein L29 [Legionellales bacterium RIFCSPHIGHO2_12_FULL_42_9]|nr:MAG: 50S ribosomal protein L29 [Legionellales bacterium RIFCSPHIGHO2_12_FULL_42_9]
MQKLTELKKMTLEELDHELLRLRRIQLDLRFKKANLDLDKTHVVRNARKNIARIKTIMTQKKVGKM